MGVIGNQIAAGIGSVAIANDSFNGTGSATAFTLSKTVSATTDIEVLVDNVQQSPYDSSYSVSGTTLTFSAAPAAGTNNIYVIYNHARTITTNQVVPDDGSVTTAKLVDGNITTAKLHSTDFKPAGHIIQTVESTISTRSTYSVTFRQWVATGLKVSITPKSANPTLIIIANVVFSSANFNVGYVLRDNTATTEILFNPGNSPDSWNGNANRKKLTSGGVGSQGFNADWNGSASVGNDFGASSRSVTGLYTPPSNAAREIEVYLCGLNNTGTVILGGNENNANDAYDSWSYSNIMIQEIAG